MDKEQDDVFLFENFVLNTKPLSRHHINIYVKKSRPLITPNHVLISDEEFDRVHLSEWDLEKSHIQSSEIISYKRCHLSKKQWRAFTQGNWKPSYSLDLHGLARENAWEAVQGYVDDLYCSQHKFGLIVHGRGHYSQDGVAYLKNMLAQHLQKLPTILAYHSAMPKDGGAGAVYVMIKSK